MRPFAVFDIDGTLIRWQLYHAVANVLAKEGLFDEATSQIIKSSRMAWKRRDSDESFKAYEEHLVDAYDQMILKINPDDFDKAANEVFEEYKDQVYIYTRDLIKRLKSEGFALFAVSGSQSEIVKKIADYYGFDDSVGTKFERVDGHFTGKKESVITDKKSAIETLVSKHELTWRGSIAVGDSLSDVAMLEAVDNPIAFNPEKKLFDHTKDNDWQIVVERKNTVYELRSSDGEYKLVG